MVLTKSVEPYIKLVQHVNFGVKKIDETYHSSSNGSTMGKCTQHANIICRLIHVAIIPLRCCRKKKFTASIWPVMFVFFSLVVFQNNINNDSHAGALRNIAKHMNTRKEQMLVKVE